jgi:hypothetical protein
MKSTPAPRQISTRYFPLCGSASFNINISTFMVVLAICKISTHGMHGKSRQELIGCILDLENERLKTIAVTCK